VPWTPSERAPVVPAIVSTLLVAAGLLALGETPPFRVLDLQTWDRLRRARGEIPADERIALVTIDDATLRAYGRWPLSRDTYALLLSALEDAGVGAVGLDLLFLDPNEEGRRLDLLLASVTGAHSNVVHAAAAFRGKIGESAGVASRTGLVRRDVIETEPVVVAEAGEMALPFSELVEAGCALGHVSVLLDEDGTVRRVPLLLRHDGDLHPALSVRLAGLALGWPDPLEVRPSPGGLLLSRGESDPLPIPADDEGGTAFEFAGSQHAFNGYSMLEVLQWYRDGRSEQLAAAFRDRIVLVGVTAVAEAAADLGSTPFSTATPLVYVHANLLNALLHERLLRDVPARLVWLGTLLFAAVLGAVLGTLRLGGSAAAAVVAVGGVAVGEFLLLSRGIRLPPTPTLLLAPVGLLVLTAYRVLFFERSLREWGPLLDVLRPFRGRLFRGSGRAAEGGLREIGNYRLESLLGKGGMGEVWRAKHRMLDRPAAVKLIRPETLGLATPELAMTILRRFEREVQSTANLKSEHTVDIYDFGVDGDGTFFYAMELLEGLNLDDLVRGFGPLPPERAIHVLLQTCDSLDEAHRAGLIHRDVKPANILLCRQANHADHVKVVDFGLVKKSEELAGGAGLTRQGTVAGTPGFMAPEQASSRVRLDSRADLYSLGCVAYWLLSGRLVFERDDPIQVLIAHAREEPRPLSELAEVELPEGLEEIVMSCLRKNPDERPSSASSLASWLRECAPQNAWTEDRAASWWHRHRPVATSVDAAAPPADGETQLIGPEGETSGPS